MDVSGRRKFLKQSLVAGVAMAMPEALLSMNKSESAPYQLSLNPGAIGVKLPFHRTLKIAIKYGFQAISPNLNDIGNYSKNKRTEIQKELEGAGMTWDSASFPVQFRHTEAQFRKDLKGLESKAQLLRQINGNRMNTWIMPTSNEYTYRENFEIHAERIHKAAQVLKGDGIRLGLEYVGPKTLMARDQYAFIHTMKELKQLLAEINMSNVGIQLDAFHWYCARESVEDITGLDPNEIITVDLNDAVLDRTPDQQLDGERELPGDSGVIDLRSFLKALQVIGYTGPVRAEPFNQRLNDMKPEAAIATTFKAMKRSFINATG